MPPALQCTLQDRHSTEGTDKAACQDCWPLQAGDCMACTAPVDQPKKVEACRLLLAPSTCR